MGGKIDLPKVLQILWWMMGLVLVLVSALVSSTKNGIVIALGLCIFLAVVVLINSIFHQGRSKIFPAIIFLTIVILSAGIWKGHTSLAYRGWDTVFQDAALGIDIDGNKIDVDNPWHVNKAGFVQHSLFHRTLPDAHAIIHTHTTATVAVCSLEGGLQPVNFYACNFMGQLAYHDFEGVTVREEEGVRLVEHLGDKRILMLRNHGPVVMGKTLTDAFIKYWALQRACEHQMATLQMGNPIMVSPEVIAVHQRDLYMASPPGGSGRVEFDAMVRKVDQIDKSWRD
jgi:ribulose-5-phosphate 4-epimerase/fuculose-1-phosphate aldolase